MWKMKRFGQLISFSVLVKYFYFYEKKKYILNFF